MRRTWKYNRIINILEDKDKTLFQEDKFKSIDLVNRKLNLIINMLTEPEEYIDDTAEAKGIFEQNNISTDDMVGQFITKQYLKNAELQQAIDALGQGVVQLMLRGAIR